MAELPPFHRLYGDALAFLPSPIVRVHDVRETRMWRGEARVENGRSLMARAICSLLRFPPASDCVSLSVSMPRGQGEIWKRGSAIIR
jgi:hypothetical protein